MMKVLLAPRMLLAKAVAAVAVNPVRPAEITAATADGKIFVSHDETKTWQAVRP